MPLREVRMQPEIDVLAHVSPNEKQRNLECYSSKFPMYPDTKGDWEELQMVVHKSKFPLCTGREGIAEPWTVGSK